MPFAVLFAALLLTPKQTLEERVLWLWFAAVMVLALFLTEKPRTHVYTFFIPWLLICGQVAALGYGWLVRRLGPRTSVILGSAAAAILILVFGNYAYRYFVSTEEVMLNYFDRRPPGYLVTYDEPDNKARFGFPLNNGWKVIGELYRQGDLSGYFDTNEKEAWVPAWYSRGVERCPATPSGSLKSATSNPGAPTTRWRWNITCARASRNGGRCRSKTVTR